MPKPRRTYPGFFKSEPSPQGQAFIDCISGVLQGQFECVPLFQTQDKIHVYFVGSASKYGLLIEPVEHTSEDPGVFVSDVAFWCDLYGSGITLCAEMTSHSWDAWLAACQSGDKSLIEGPTGKRNKARDQLSADYGVNRDRITVSCGPASETPEALLGVSVQKLSELIHDYGHRIQQVLPNALSAWVVPSDEMRTLEITIVDSDGSETTSEAEVPDSYGVYLQNESPFLLSNIAIKAGGFGTVDDEHWQRPTRQFRCFLEPKELLQIDTLDAGDLDFVNWYYLTASPPKANSRTFECLVRGQTLADHPFEQIEGLEKKGYKMPLEPARDAGQSP